MASHSILRRARSDVRGPTAGFALARLATTLAVVSVGALALGAVAIGALAIRALAVKAARIQRLEIGELVVGGRPFRIPAAEGTA